jgi:hypothetical protein
MVEAYFCSPVQLLTYEFISGDTDPIIEIAKTVNIIIAKNFFIILISMYFYLFIIFVGVWVALLER